MADTDIVTQTVDPVLDTVGSTLASGFENPGLLTELGAGLLVLVLVISVHGWCMGAVSKFFAIRFARFGPDAAQWRVSFLVSITVGLLATVHLVETLLWVLPIWWFGFIDGFRDSFYFVLESYTTLGAAKVALPEAWSLTGPMIAISGLFTFSWTGSVMVYVVSETGRRHSRNTAHAAAARPADPAAPDRP
jgi:hypothetical protein